MASIQAPDCCYSVPMERVPTDLSRVLAAHPAASAAWKSLTPLARHDFITWITSAKQADTRKRRVESIPSRLASGKRRPCCYAVVPMGLYKALGENAKAQAVWKGLDPMERRGYTGWVEAAPGAPERKRRITKACALLEAGKRRP
jgi:uncharacterized protein YdeI (YjbR/CyaY-like superfamily)